MEDITLKSSSIETTPKREQALFANISNLFTDLKNLKNAALKIVSVNQGVYGSGILVPVITVDKNKNITKITNTAINFPVDSRIWFPSKYHIEAGEVATVPEKYQQLISTPFINDGEVIIDGKLIDV